MEKIAVFGFNTTSGKVFEVRNATKDEIKVELVNMFPKWSNDAIERILNNPNNYKEVIPITKDEKKSNGLKKERMNFKTPILICGYEINNLLRLGRSLHAYHKNGYRQWGCCINEVFDDWKITPFYNDFERRYERLTKVLKTAPQEELKTLTLNMCNALEKLYKGVDGSGVLRQDKDMEYINGCGRRLGLAELMERAKEFVNECVTAIG